MRTLTYSANGTHRHVHQKGWRVSVWFTNRNFEYHDVPDEGEANKLRMKFNRRVDVKSAVMKPKFF